MDEMHLAENASLTKGLFCYRRCCYYVQSVIMMTAKSSEGAFLRHDKDGTGARKKPKREGLIVLLRQGGAAEGGEVFSDVVFRGCF